LNDVVVETTVFLFGTTTFLTPRSLLSQQRRRHFSQTRARERPRVTPVSTPPPR
jgi:hypothetical protein